MAQETLRFGDQLREELERREISQRELARRLVADREDYKAVDVQRRSIRRHLLNEVQPTWPTRAAYARALGLAPDYFERLAA